MTHLSVNLTCTRWSEFYAPLRYACDGGKRVRPLILVISNESLQYHKTPGFSEVDEDAFMAASAIESCILNL